MPDETDRTQKVTSHEIIKENNNDSLFTLKKDSNRANLINPDLNTKKLQIKQFINVIKKIRASQNFLLKIKRKLLKTKI